MSDNDSPSCDVHSQSRSRSGSSGNGYHSDDNRSGQGYSGEPRHRQGDEHRSKRKYKEEPGYSDEHGSKRKYKEEPGYSDEHGSERKYKEETGYSDEHGSKRKYKEEPGYSEERGSKRKYKEEPGHSDEHGSKRKFSDEPRDREGDEVKGKMKYSDSEPRDDVSEGGPRSELRLLINSRDAGVVIGKGGSNIKRMRVDCRAGIMVTDSRTPERVLVVTGDVEALHDVCTEVFKGLEDKYSCGRREGDVTAKLLIHQSQAGCVIGKAGSQLKEFRADFGVDIKVYPQCCPLSTERIVQMIGRVGGVARCIISITRMLDGWPPKGPRSAYDPSNHDEAFVQDYGGFADDDRGGRSGGGRDRDRRSPDGRRYSGGSGGSRDRMGVDRGRGLGLGLGMGAQGGLAALMPRRTSQQVSIPGDLVGVIIGKAGQKIRQIRADSGAEVQVSEDAGPGERIITISGSPDQIQNAQYLLQTCVKQHLARRNT